MSFDLMSWGYPVSFLPALPVRRALLCSSALILVQAPAATAVEIFVPPDVQTTVALGGAGDTLTVEEGGTIDTRVSTGGSSGNGVSATNNNQTVNNSGAINGQFDGIRWSGAQSFTLFNSATGTITSIGSSSNTGDAVQLDGDNGTIINHGLLQGGFRGIFLLSSEGTGITNTNGAVIEGGTHGVVVESNSDHVSITNANGAAIKGQTRGVYLGSSDNVRIANTGGAVIDAAYGVSFFSSHNAEISNTNGAVITGDIDGIVLVDSDNAHITNGARIIGDRFAVFINSDSDNATLNLLAGSVIDGRVRFSGSNPTLNIGNGLNLHLIYESNDPTVNSDVPYVFDAANNIVYTVDPSGFALSQSFLQTMAVAVHGAVRSGAERGNSFGGGFSGNETFAYGTEAPGFAETGPRGWASGFGGYQSQNGSGNTTGGDQAYGGLVTGGGFASDRLLYGGFLGGARSRLATDHDTQRIDAASFYAGLYGGTRNGAFWISASLMGGHTDFSSDRTVANNTVAGGLETATADYGGYFVSPSVTVGRAMGERTEVSFGAAYAGLFLDGYTETGSVANLSVASRDVHVAAVRAELRYLAKRQQTGNGTVSVETWAGVDGFFNLGGDDVTAALAGTTLNFPASFADSTAIGFAGIGINHKPDNGNWQVNGALEGRVGSDAYTEIRASVGATVHF